jgi:hypothetical protein
MPRPCTICIHAEHQAIDQALVNGAPNLRVAQQYDVTEQAIRRHKTDHLPETLSQAKDARTVAQADDLLAQVKGLRGKAVGLLLKAEQAGDYRTALLGIREARGCLELLAKLQGQLDERPQINILILPEWERVRGAMIAALAPYPEARIAVAAALRGIDARE